ncbi:MAG: hypothetical protein GW748_04485 [Alphaproteobacteria bacterium]|nr:hypothetical protein [Alphaproteobacteria bacterium]NCQ66981.1 hypothetical protein [Alphaproteobacteria bacterium]NCT07578.1 hypothetical protein [Alphaproteobacteria bacterium]
MMKFLKIIAALFLFILAFFIYINGDEVLAQTGIGFGELRYTLLILVVIAPILLGLLLFMGAMKMKAVKYIIPLLLIDAIAIIWISSTL